MTAHLIDIDGDAWVEAGPDRFVPATIGAHGLPWESNVHGDTLADVIAYGLAPYDPLPDPTVAEPEALAELAGVQEAADERVAELRRHAEVCHATKPLPPGDEKVKVRVSYRHLDNLREAWEYGADDEVIVARVRDLFEGSDGTLAVIDRVLGNSNLTGGQR